MVSPRHKNTILFVKALPDKQVREIDTDTGRPLMAMRFVGKDNGVIIEEGVKIPYHVHYIDQLKKGALLPVDVATAVLAGVPHPPKQPEQVNSPMIKENQCQ